MTERPFRNLEGRAGDLEPARPDQEKAEQAPSKAERLAAHWQDIAEMQRAADTHTVVDDENEIHGVLTANDEDLAGLLRDDRGVRDALRWQPGNREAECARTLLAAARVKRRRRRCGDAVSRVGEWEKRRSA